MSTIHGAYLELAAIAVDFDLEPEEARTLEGHLATCRDCRSRAAAIRRDAVALAGLSVLPVSRQTSDRLWRGVFGRRSSLTTARTLALAAVLALALLGAALVGAAVYRAITEDLALTPNTPPTLPIASPDPNALPGYALATDVAGQPPTRGEVVAGAPGGFVAFGDISCPGSEGGAGSVDCQQAVHLSPDGREWEQLTGVELGDVRADDGSAGVAAVAAGPAGYLAVGTAGTGDGWTEAAWFSSDARAWTRIDVPDTTDAEFSDVAALGDAWIIVGHRTTPTGVTHPAAWRSDGLTIRQSAGQELDPGETVTATFDHVAASGPAIVATGFVVTDGGDTSVTYLWRSSDGTTWDSQEIRVDPLDLLVVAEGFYVPGEYLNVHARSTDGVTWSLDSTLGVNHLLGVAHAAGLWVAADEKDGVGSLLGSTDGSLWRPLDLGSVELDWITDGVVLAAYGDTILLVGSGNARIIRVEVSP